MANKSDLINKMAKESVLTKKTSERVLNALLETIEEELFNGNKFRLNNIGSFYTVLRKEREGINPQTGEKMTIPARWVVKFKPGKRLKEKVY